MMKKQAIALTLKLCEENKKLNLLLLAAFVAAGAGLAWFEFNEHAVRYLGVLLVVVPATIWCHLYCKFLLALSRHHPVISRVGEYMRYFPSNSRSEYLEVRRLSEMAQRAQIVNTRGRDSAKLLL